ncbi:hypothetical protein I79_017986 [Cricetulus griseus]|uniref:Uncharacterized protein n=1 Tax=Cricetulus griseus TaxID=10029 RepID=G3I3H8_CRIGR|nr:hypothetical protein I79_017986 [Cricetulus griseus]
MTPNERTVLLSRAAGCRSWESGTAQLLKVLEGAHLNLNTQRLGPYSQRPSPGALLHPLVKKTLPLMSC